MENDSVRRGPSVRCWNTGWAIPALVPLRAQRDHTERRGGTGAQGCSVAAGPSEGPPNPDKGQEARAAKGRGHFSCAGCTSCPFLPKAWGEAR